MLLELSRYYCKIVVRLNCSIKHYSILKRLTCSTCEVVDENRRANDAAQEEIYPQIKIITEHKKSGVTPIESLQFDFGTIRDATDNFSVENKLGHGGFGTVYKVT